MGESHLPQHQGLPPARSGRLRAAAGGQIVEVQGGHILRSAGRKDRHSKVFTSKGPRDRRVRLSAHTAIHFYDVQDRLGYDRPSKAVDWLIQNAKAAIDELAELPPWHPTGAAAAASCPSVAHESPETAEAARESGEKAPPEEAPAANSTYGFTTGNFLPPSLDSDAIADTIKSFFPIAATTGAPSSPPVGFQSYTGRAQDLRLSLQSFQDPIFLHHQPPHTSHHHPTSPATEQASLFSGSSIPFTFDANPTGWSELNQRVFPWSAASGETGGGGGYMFTVPPQQVVPVHCVLGQNPLFTTQRGPLQSSNSPHVRTWTDPSVGDNQTHSAAPGQPGQSFSAVGFGGLSGFRIPARIQGEEEHDGLPKKPPFASRH